LEYREPAIGHAALHFEAAEAARCIAAGVEVMNEIRGQLGIRYPTETSSGSR
jgi:hypothetical protein